MDKLVWINYDDEKPTEAGLYWWRLVGHKFSDTDIQLEWVEKFRKRYAGHDEVLSPGFDYWDGYRVILPPNIQWAKLREGDNEKSFHLPGIKLLNCPFCNAEPTLSSCKRGHDGGVYVTASFYEYNNFQIKCKNCECSSTPYIWGLKLALERWNTRA